MAAALGGLARRLVTEGIISEEEALSASKEAIKEKKGLVSYLVENELANPRNLATLAAD